MKGRGVVLRVLTAWALSAAISVASTGQDHPEPQPEGPTLTDVRILGASIYTPDELQRRHGVLPGVRLDKHPEEVARDIRHRYHSDGYTFVEATASLDAAGVLTVEIDEGQIDEIEFRGVDAPVAARLREEFAVQPGDVFNRPQATRALDEALAIGQGAVERRRAQDAFTMIRENGRRVLQVNLRTRSNRSGVFLGTQGREDWYSPVDGLNAAVGFESTIFDPRRFNHAYWAAYVSYKVAADRAGYSFGFERPFFREGVFQAGASIQDVTASDDRWRLSPAEQSLVALGFRNTFRDYYRRKGYQVHAAVRPYEDHEWLVAWRSEDHFDLINETSYGFFRDDHGFRENAAVVEGDLRAVIAAYTFDSRGLARESPGARFRRHQIDSLFGSDAPQEHGARIEWISEIAPGAFDHDFDFMRHVVHARGWREIAPGRMLGGRVLAGLIDGTPPPQRMLGLGGIGTVRGYAFKEAVGERMLLLSGEVRQRFGRSGLAGLAFADAGRVYRPIGSSTEDWLTGIGVGLELGGTRIEFGWRLDDVPSSLQVLFRFGPAF